MPQLQDNLAELDPQLTSHQAGNREKALGLLSFTLQNSPGGRRMFGACRAPQVVPPSPGLRAENALRSKASADAIS